MQPPRGRQPFPNSDDAAIPLARLSAGVRSAHMQASRHRTLLRPAFVCLPISLPPHPEFPTRPLFPLESRQMIPGDCPQEQRRVRWAPRDECPARSTVHRLPHCPTRPRLAEGPLVVRRRRQTSASTSAAARRQRMLFGERELRSRCHHFTRANVHEPDVSFRRLG